MISWFRNPEYFTAMAIKERLSYWDFIADFANKYNCEYDKFGMICEEEDFIAIKLTYPAAIGFCTKP